MSENWRLRAPYYELHVLDAFQMKIQWRSYAETGGEVILFCFSCKTPFAFTGTNKKHLTQKQTHHIHHIITMAHSVSISEGRDFYDDEYDDELESLEDRIDFSKLKFYGRQEELQILHDIYSSVCSKQTERGKDDVSAALISGYSGTGKAALVKQFVDDINTASQKQSDETKPCFFLRGKYGKQCADPYSAIAEAFSAFSSMLQLGDPQELKRVRRGIQKAIGTESKVLTDLVPDLQELFGEEDIGVELPLAGRLTRGATISQGMTRGATISPKKTKRASFQLSRGPSIRLANKRASLKLTRSASILDLGISREMGVDRIKYAFQTFVKAISTKDRPVVMFLDDLQWADSASLDLIATLLTDKSLQHFMFVGAMRSNEVDKNHPLIQRLEIIKQTKTIESIELMNLSIEDFGGFIMSSLELDELDEIKSLTEAIYSKTRGNIYYAMQAMEELQRNKILFHCKMNFRWVWNLEGVDMSAAISNPVDFVVGKIQKSPEKLRQALTILAYTRPSMDVNTLHLLMEVAGYIVTPGDLLKILDTAVLEGLLSNNVGSPTYKFAHNRIQEAAYSLVQEKERDDLRWILGRTLFELGSLSDSGKDWMLFVGADHLNAVEATDPSSSTTFTFHDSDPLFMARMNLKVGETASTVAAFSRASGYLQRGMEILIQIPSYWKDHYDLSLKLFQNITAVELFQGNFDKGNKFGQELLDNAKIIKDMIPTHLALARAAARQNKHVEAVKMNQKALKMTGKYPKRKMACMIKDYFAVKRFLNKNTDYDILLLPVMTDETRLATMSIFAALSMEAYMCGDLVEFLFATLRKLRISFEHGLCGETATGLVYFSMVLLGNLGDPVGGRRLSSLARKVCELTNVKAVEATVIYSANYFIDAWDTPHAEVLANYQRGHKIGMEAGNIDFAFKNWYMSNAHAFLAGFPLGPIVKATQGMKDWTVLNKIDFMDMDQLRLPMLHLSGHAGKTLDFEELAKFGPRTDDPKSETYRLMLGYQGRLELAIYFGEYSFAETMAAKYEEVSSHDTSYLVMIVRVFYSGLVASGMERQTKKKKYRTKAKKLAKQMKQLVRANGLNGLHRELLLEAELVDSKKANEEKGREKYERAIAAALKAGHVHDAALACELAGEFLLRIGNTTTCRQYFTQSRSHYVDWGAKVKVAHLELKRGPYMDEETEKTAGSSRETVNLDVLGSKSAHTITKHQQPDVRLLRRAGDDGSMDGSLFSMVSMWSDSETSKEL
jgi:predicted ATPase